MTARESQVELVLEPEGEWKAKMGQEERVRPQREDEARDGYIREAVQSCWSRAWEMECLPDGEVALTHR